jgi:hypothetical protein
MVRFGKQRQGENKNEWERRDEKHAFTFAVSTLACSEME